MVEKRQQLLRERQVKTYREMCECLKKNGMCCVVRPTGFGKTKLFMDYVADHRDGEHLYIYDTNSAKSDIKTKYNTDNVEFLSYSALSRKKSRESVIKYICSSPWHTIIFDEAHLMGGENIKKLLVEILPLAVASGVRILGGTATQLRTDLVDVYKSFFHGCGVSDYTLEDAIQDGIMLEPVWVVTAHYRDLLKSLEKYENANSYVKTSLSQLTRAYANIDGVASVYSDTVKEVYKKVPDIMRFIIFYPTIDAINDNFEKDIQEFHKAFPGHRVHWGRLTSSSEHSNTITQIEDSFTNEGKQVQLIFSVNMLNQSYHSEALTGIVMYRATLSNIIFTQELGRVMSVLSQFRGIVFDNVGNVFMRPDVAMALIQTFNGIPSGQSRKRGHLDLKLNATQELIDFNKVYQRIMATKEITQEQIDIAKGNWARHKKHMPWEDFEAITKMPRYVIEPDSLD